MRLSAFMAYSFLLRVIQRGSEEADGMDIFRSGGLSGGRSEGDDVSRVFPTFRQGPRWGMTAFLSQAFSRSAKVESIALGSSHVARSERRVRFGVSGPNHGIEQSTRAPPWEGFNPPNRISLRRIVVR